MGRCCSACRSKGISTGRGMVATWGISALLLGHDCSTSPSAFTAQPTSQRLFNRPPGGQQGTEALLSYVHRRCSTGLDTRIFTMLALQRGSGVERATQGPKPMDVVTCATCCGPRCNNTLRACPKDTIRGSGTLSTVFSLWDWVLTWRQEGSPRISHRRNPCEILPAE